MPDDERRWRVHKEDGLWQVLSSDREFVHYESQSWGSAMGFANLYAWMDRGNNPAPPVEYSEGE